MLYGALGDLMRGAVCKRSLVGVYRHRDLYRHIDAEISRAIHWWGGALGKPVILLNESTQTSFQWSLSALGDRSDRQGFRGPLGLDGDTPTEVPANLEALELAKQPFAPPILSNASCRPVETTGGHDLRS
jgi:hypothetical protein